MAIKDMSYLFPVYPIFCYITALGCLFPIPAHWRQGNVAVVWLGIWLFFALIIAGTNSVVWHGNLMNPHPIWGDICSAFWAICSITITCCMLCVQYRLWSVVKLKSVFITKQQKKRRIWTTCLFCMGVPAILGAVHYVVQGHRYDVYEDIGPWTETYNVTLAYPLYWVWDPLLCGISGVFCILTIITLLRHRREFDVILSSGAKNITRLRYLRLLGLAAAGIFLHFPLVTWVVIANAVGGVEPWISWEDTHYNYSRIGYYSRFYISLIDHGVIRISVPFWAVVLAGVCYWIFFGIGEEASQEYKWMFRSITNFFRRRSSSLPSSTSPSGEKADTRTRHRRSTAKSETTTVVANPSEKAPSRRSSISSRATSSSESSGGGDSLQFDDDFEAQNPPPLTLEEQRRLAILENNPELTEEVTF